jgi:hypothetical protein
MGGTIMDMRVATRAYAGLDALGPQDYVDILTALKAIRSMERLPGRRMAVANDQFDVHFYEPPRSGKVIVIVGYPDAPRVVTFAGLWPDPGDKLPLVERIASEAASAVGIINPRIFVPGLGERP